MYSIRGWTRLRASVCAFGLVAASAGAAQAAPMMTYNTIGSMVGEPGMSVAPDTVTFVPVSGASFLAPSSLSLGAFEVKTLPVGQTVTYDNIPFSIKFTTTQIGKDTPNPNSTPFTISGHLSGTVNGPSQSNVVATFDKAPPTTSKGGIGAGDSTDPGFQFTTGLYANTLKIADNPLTLVPSTTNSGLTTVQANLTGSTYTAPVPEPSTILLFAATAAGLGLRRQIRRARLAD